MIDFVLWYLSITVVGWVSFPLAFRFLSKLADRGFGLARVIGLLVWAYLFWLLNSLQIAQNNTGGLVFAFSILVILSFLALRKIGWKTMTGWISEHRTVLITSEVLFLLLFAGWSVVRASSPDIAGTEKPMEMAFINSILHSPSFPPQDPWLSGYSISYYYFGYVMVAMLTRLTGVLTGSAFNLGIALWFAMTGLAAYSLLYSLLHSIRRKTSLTDEEKTPQRQANVFSALLGPFFVLIVSNLEGLLEMLHAKGIFWKSSAGGTLTSAFWQWLDIQELVQPPSPPLSLVPQRIGGIWWWRASRVLQDFTASGQSKEIIDEFPFFSYYLADLHPHVLSMPFVLLAIGLAFNLFLKTKSFASDGKNLFAWLSEWVGGGRVTLQQLRLTGWLKSIDFWFAALVMGSLAFLNTWDFPIYVALFGAVFTFNRSREDGWSSRRIVDFLGICLTLGLLGVILYLPFYFGFSSQAGGFLPSLYFYTRGVQLWVMFAPLLVPVFIWLLWTWRKYGNRHYFFVGLRFSGLVVGTLWLLSLAFGILLASLPVIGAAILASQGETGLLSNLAHSFIEWGNLFDGLQGISTPLDIFGSVVNRLAQPGAWITLVALLTFIWGLLASYRDRSDTNNSEMVAAAETNGETQNTSHLQNIFPILMLLVASGLTLAPEFFYLRDQFAWRMNTIFKFYFQAWILLAIVAAYASIRLWNGLKLHWKPVFGSVWVLLILSASAYPAWGLSMKLRATSIADYTLNGAKYIENYNPDEMDAIQFLSQSPYGVVLEAVGGSYSSYARISTFSGLPTVLGWPGHEVQWRGGAEELGSREGDIKEIYQSNDWIETESLLAQYGVRYIYIGNLEQAAYNVNASKFASHLQPVFQEGNVTIYAVPGTGTSTP